MLSCEQINQAIAKQRNEVGIGPLRVVRTGLGGGDYYTTCDRDYCHDWAAAGPLLEKMAEAGMRPRLGYVGPDWVMFWFPGHIKAEARLEVRLLPELITRAYHAAFCKEE